MSAVAIETVLIIEDNPGDFLLAEEFLIEQLQPVEITHALSFQDASEKLFHCEKPFDIILLDLSLPDNTGETLIRDIVKISLNAPIIVLTGYADLSFGVTSLGLGASDYILKEELTALSLYKSMVYSIERKKIILDLETSERRVRSFAKQLNDVIEEDRSRIAREIHDEFGQQLSGLKMSLTALRRTVDKNDGIQLIDAITADVDTSIQTLRKIANELRPVMLDKFGLFAAIEWLVNEFERKTGIKTGIYVEAHQPVINSTVEINIFRICQEALTNIVKHANATFVNVQVENLHNQLSVRIADNGIGIKLGGRNKMLSMGLVNMEERAAIIGAKLTITDTLPSGTLIELIVNLNGEKDINSRRSLGN